MCDTVFTCPFCRPLFRRDGTAHSRRARYSASPANRRAQFASSKACVPRAAASPRSSSNEQCPARSSRMRVHRPDAGGHDGPGRPASHNAPRPVTAITASAACPAAHATITVSPPCKVLITIIGAHGSNDLVEPPSSLAPRQLVGCTRRPHVLRQSTPASGRHFRMIRRRGQAVA